MYLSGLSIIRGSGMAHFAIQFEKTIAIDHRNVLGELMHLGITRESIGDIDVSENRSKLLLISDCRIFYGLT